MTFRNKLDELHVLWGPQVMDGGSLITHDEAVGRLRNVIDDPDALERLRAVVASELGQDVGEWSDAVLVDVTASMLEMRRLTWAQHATADGSGGGGGPGTQPQPPPTQPPGPVPPVKPKPSKQPFSLVTLSYPDVIAPGEEDPQPDIAWTIVDPSARITSGKIEILRSHTDKPSTPIMTLPLSSAELAEGDHTLPWDGGVGTQADFPQAHTSVEFSPYTIKLTVTDGAEKQSKTTSFQVLATRLELAFGESDLLERDIDEELLDSIVSVGSTASSNLELELASDIYRIADSEIHDEAAPVFGHLYEGKWGAGPQLPLVAAVFFRNSQGDEVLAPSAWGRRKVFWRFDFDDLNGHVGGAAGAFIRTSADYLVNDTRPKGSACHADRGGKRAEDSVGFFRTTKGTQFPVKSPQPAFEFAGRHSGSVDDGPYRGKTGVLFSPARQAGEGYIVHASFDPRKQLDVPTPPKAAFAQSTGAWQVFRRVTIGKLVKKTGSVPEFPASKLDMMPHFRQSFVNVHVTNPAYEVIDEQVFNDAVKEAVAATFVGLGELYVDGTINQHAAGGFVLRVRTFDEFKAFAHALPPDHPHKAGAMTTASAPNDEMYVEVFYNLLFNTMWFDILNNVHKRMALPEGITFMVFEGQTNLDPRKKALASALADPPDLVDPADTGVAPHVFDRKRALASVNGINERTAAHELGHCLFLGHAQAKESKNSPGNAGSGIGAPPLKSHDAISKSCLMNYDFSDVQLCGFCQLLLRGWDLRGLSNEAANNQ